VYKQRFPIKWAAVLWSSVIHWSPFGPGVGCLFCREKGVWAQRVLFPRRKGTPRRAQPPQQQAQKTKKGAPEGAPVFTQSLV